MPSYQAECEQLLAQSRGHRLAIEKSRICGCFHCERFLAPHQIESWVVDPGEGADGPEQTALCPWCGVDAVLPEWNGVYPIGVAVLRRMRGYWFGGAVRAG